MKNKTQIFYLILFLFFYSSNVYSFEKFTYEAGQIEVLDKGNIIKSSNGVKIFINENIDIFSDTFEYNKKKGLVTLSGNVKIIDKINNFIVNTSEIFYFQNENKISSNAFSKFIFEDKYFAESNSFQYLINASQITSNKKMKIYDIKNNIFYIDSFKYEIKNNLFKGSNTRFIDEEKNEYLISNTIIDLTNNHISGKDLNINFNKSTFGNNENDPRLKSRSFLYTENSSSMNKGVFTTCKKNDKCPPWKIYADNITHDKKKETIEYSNAWLKIYDIPVAYFPKFSHPDPTVTRKSGFLKPSLLNSNVHGLALSVPYYLVLSENKDITFNPRMYANDQIIIQGEYRQVNKDSKHIMDLGFNKDGYFSSKSKSKSHFFSNSVFNLGLDNFETSNFKLNIEKTTNDTYLKTYKINSPLIDNNALLNSYISFNAENEDLTLSASMEAWEDLSKTSSDKYEFIYPNYKILKELNLDNSNLELSSYGYQKNYETNKYEGIITNDLIYKADPKIFEWGLKSNFDALLRNVNTNAENSSKYKNNFDQSLLSLLLFSTEYPMKKSGDIYEDSLIPKLSLMYSPNKTKNMSDEDKRIDVNNIYSFNRLGVTDTVEGGTSITLGTEYKKVNKKNYEDFINLKLATVLRKEKNEDLPTNSSLGNSQSDYFGNFKIKPHKNINFNYNFAIDNNLDKSNFDSIETKFTVNNFATTFEYLDDKNAKVEQSYITNKTSVKINNSGSFGFNLRKNRVTSATEYYDLFYSYTNDCLEAAITFNKSYYSDSDLKPEKQLFFSLTIIPFGKINSPTFGE
tara:strand:- start:1931 stop:4327 length:2397 start_codon:yes stop_codon:yes gene_type:complete